MDMSTYNDLWPQVVDIIGFAMVTAVVHRILAQLFFRSGG